MFVADAQGKLCLQNFCSIFLSSIRTETLVKSVSVEFVLGEEFNETTIDDRKVRSIFSLEDLDEGGRRELLQWQTDKQGRKARIGRTLRREGQDELMDITMECNGVFSTAVFRRIK